MSGLRKRGFTDNETAFVWALRLIAILLIVGGWVLYGTKGAASSVLLPDPWETAKTTGSLLGSSELWYHARVTLFETVMAFAIACLLSLLIGALAARSTFWGQVIEPMLGWGYMVPQVVLFPLFILWLGIDSTSKIGFAAAGAFFPMGLSMVRAVRSVDPRYIRTARAFGAAESQIDLLVRWPASLPLFISGLRVGAALSLILVILAEMLAATAGLGFMLTRATQLYRSAEAFGVVLVMIALSGVFYFTISWLTSGRKFRN